MSASDRVLKDFASSCHCVVNRLTVAADRPAPLPRNCSSAGTKSEVDRPCKYSSGNTSATRGDLRDQAGRIAEENRLRSPVPGSVRLSFTRGAFTSTTPAAVVTWRGWW